MAEFRFAHDHAGEEGAERQRDAEKFGGAESHAQSDRQHGKAKKFARTGMRHVMQHPRDDAAADDQHDDDEGGDLGEGDAEHAPQAKIELLREEIADGSRRAGAAENAGQRRQQHQCQHHREILDDQPADRDAAALGLDHPALLQRSQQHHGAGDRQRQAKNQACADRPAEHPGERGAERRSEADLHDCARNRDGANRQQVLQREMQADAEHQQDDAHLGKFERQVLVCDESRRVRADQDAG